MNKGLRKFLALALAGTMVFGCTMTAFASESTGQGSYEGGELQYPELSVTLSTIPEDTFDYIADPNGLIAATSNAKYTGCTFAETAQGIFFLTSTNTYTEKSAALTATNENAQNVDFTVKLEQITAGDASITYSSTAIFEDTDTANKIYLAVTDDTSAAALTDTAAAVLTTEVDGTPTNFEATYSADNGYGYTKKSGDLTWNSYSFYMTGALNMNAEWGDDLVFPEIKITWSYAEHVDQAAPSIAATEVDLVAGQDTTITVDLGVGELAATGITKITYLNSTGAEKELASSNYKLEGNILTIYATYTNGLTADRTFTILFNDTVQTTDTVTLKVATTE